MDKVIELAKQAGFGYAWTAEPTSDIDIVNTKRSILKDFYTLARADLEAENAKLKQKMVDGVTIQQYIDLDNECDVLKAENENLRTEITKLRHVLGDIADGVSRGNREAARAALGETK